MIDSDQLERLRGIALRTARGILNDAQRADDVAQDVMVRLLEEGLDDLANPDGYVARMAKFASIDQLRARKKEWVAVEEDLEWIEGIADAQPGPSSVAARPEFFRLLLAPLSEKQRFVFLAALDGVPNAEIAERFGYADARSAAVTLTRIRQLIRAPFEQDELKDLFVAGAMPAGLHAAAARATIDLEVPEPVSPGLSARASSLASEIREALAASAPNR
ncbi:RNA polymerase sigma factor [Demequina rhizosphaerae]|uniref:RNA polymerase sigma factor n=1 Tax=Demequina rhizosphaerae TaxID=1638985 RepID=UPI00146FE31E|nr:RNA polymerase sigma factor [Demequina rhizosphaerae]